MTKKEILQLLDTADFDGLVGPVETAEVDSKRSPYRLVRIGYGRHGPRVARALLNRDQ